jgi:hypothetical protein
VRSPRPLQEPPPFAAPHAPRSLARPRPRPRARARRRLLDTPPIVDTSPDAGRSATRASSSARRVRCLDDLACPDPEKLYCDADSVIQAAQARPVPPTPAVLLHRGRHPLLGGRGQGQRALRFGRLDRAGAVHRRRPCLPSATGYYSTVCQPGQTRCKGAAEQGPARTAVTGVSRALPGHRRRARAARRQPRLRGREKRCSADLTSLETRADACPGPTRTATSPATVTPPPRPRAAGVHPGARRQGRHDAAELAGSTGRAGTTADCRTLDASSTPNAKCLNSACSDPCADAARSFSYQVLRLLGGGAAEPGQLELQAAPPTAAERQDSEFALVIANPGPIAANGRSTGWSTAWRSSPRCGPPPAATGPGPSPPAASPPSACPGSSGPHRVNATLPLTSDLPVSVYQFTR